MEKQEPLSYGIEPLKKRFEEAKKRQAEKLKQQQLEQRLFQAKLLVAGAILGSIITVLFQLVFM